jgi:hypothetical protein
VFAPAELRGCFARLSTPFSQEIFMLLDPLFGLLGVPGTVAILFGIVAFVGVPAVATVMCPKSAYVRLQRTR